MRYFDQIQDVMIRSGQLIMQSFRQDIQVTRKPDGSLVTSVDIENELFLKKELTKIIPNSGFIAEESGLENELFDFIWVIDPLDGTRNFIKGIPHFCISVALTCKGVIIAAAIYNPIMKDLYYAEKDSGAWLNGIHKLIIQNKKFEIDGIITVIDDVDFTKIKSQLTVQKSFEKMHISNRYFGSVGLDTAYLAAGYVDYMVCENIAWWDIAAGKLLIEQAGSVTEWCKKQENTSQYGCFKAGNPKIYQCF